MALTQAEKRSLLEKNPKCYICKEAGVPDADFAGYELGDIQFDHWLAQSVVGNNQQDVLENQRPIHAKSGGVSPLNPAWPASTRRNCHTGKTDRFTGSEWVRYITINRRAASLGFADDLMPDRDPADRAFRVSITWDNKRQEATFRDQTYPVMTQAVGPGEEIWRSFSTVVPPSLLWKDEEVAPRPARPQRLTELAWHLVANPLLSPVLCRWSNDRLLVFDGNHRLTAFMLARPDHSVPVTIFDGPTPDRFFSVVSDAHDELAQIKYQYSEKALKYSGLTEQELERARKLYGDEASEVRAWAGITPARAKLRIVGRITDSLDQEENWRLRWKELGLGDSQWNSLLATYAKTTPESRPFGHAEYFRAQELTNLGALCRAFDEELFQRLPDQAIARSLKTKWWKMAHLVFREQLRQVVKHTLALPDLPSEPAYSPEWTEHILNQLPLMVGRWREAPVWRTRTAENNEFEIRNRLRESGFTMDYLGS